MKEPDSIRQARDFAVVFRPYPDKDTANPAYDWVYDLAIGQYERLRAVFNRLDDKATSVFTAVGGSTGIFTLGSLLALASDKVSPWVVLAAMPAWLSAVASLVFATMARMTKTTHHLSIAGATGFVEDLQGDGNPKAAYIGHLNLLCELMGPPLERKANLLNRSLALYAVAVVLLMLPLAAGLLAHAGKLPAFGW